MTKSKFKPGDMVRVEALGYRYRVLGSSDKRGWVQVQKIMPRPPEPIMLRASSVTLVYRPKEDGS